MMKLILGLLALGLSLASCSSTRASVMPLTDRAVVEDTFTMMWLGIGEAWRYEKGQWQRSEPDDYLFDVVQKRFPDHWESVKNRHYLHQAYNGSAGDRDQNLFFKLEYALNKDGLASKVQSTLGQGTGYADKEFRESGFILSMEDKPFFPYNRFRITQHYDYSAGKLLETVELFLEKDGKQEPFMKIEERASMYRQGNFAEIPTVWK